MNLSKVENDYKARSKTRIVPINENVTKIVIDTESDVSLMDKKDKNDIVAPDLCHKNLRILTGFGREETKPIGFFEHKIQVEGVKLTDEFHVVTGLDYDILLDVNSLSGCDLKVQKKVSKLKISPKEKILREKALYVVDMLER